MKTAIGARFLWNLIPEIGCGARDLRILPLANRWMNNWKTGRFREPRTRLLNLLKPAAASSIPMMVCRGCLKILNPPLRTINELQPIKSMKPAFAEQIYETGFDWLQFINCPQGR